MCRELASYGFFVIAINHNDESCDCTLGPEEEKEGTIERKEINFNTEFEYGNTDFRQAQLSIREDEIAKLIDQMKGKTFLAKDVGMVTKRASLDYDKIVLWGHGLGGITAISAGIRDRRISTMIGLDPWMFPCEDDVP